jgi:hypothetical protein
MTTAILVEKPTRPPAATPAKLVHENRLVEYRGLLPERSVELLARLAEPHRPFVQFMLGMFPEDRAHISSGWLLHDYLEEVPRAAARGQLTFEEVIAVKEELMREILSFRRKLNRCAEAIGMILPRVPRREDPPVHTQARAHA